MSESFEVIGGGMSAAAATPEVSIAAAPEVSAAATPVEEGGGGTSPEGSTLN